MSEPTTCKQCGARLKPGERGYCVECVIEVLFGERDMGWFR